MKSIISNMLISYYSFLFIVIFFHLGSAVVRPDYFRHSNSRKGPTETVLTSAEVGTRDDEVPEPQHQQYVTAQHCCKIGEYMARRSSTCRVDQLIRSNTLIKTKRKPRHQSDYSKSLQMQLSNCHQHQHLTQKCCLYRRLYVRALEFCEDKPNLLERIKCRWDAEEQYGH